MSPPTVQSEEVGLFLSNSLGELVAPLQLLMGQQLHHFVFHQAFQTEPSSSPWTLMLMLTLDKTNAP